MLSPALNFQLLVYAVLYDLIINADKKNDSSKLKPELFAYYSLKNSIINHKITQTEQKMRYKETGYAPYYLWTDQKEPESFSMYPAFYEEYTYEQAKTIVKDLYDIISERMLSGKINTIPYGCTFCDYSNICHNKEDQLKEEEMEILLSDILDDDKTVETDKEMEKDDE